MSGGSSTSGGMTAPSGERTPFAASMYGPMRNALQFGGRGAPPQIAGGYQPQQVAMPMNASSPFARRYGGQQGGQQGQQSSGMDIRSQMLRGAPRRGVSAPIAPNYGVPEWVKQQQAAAAAPTSPYHQTPAGTPMRDGWGNPISTNVPAPPRYGMEWDGQSWNDVRA